jgi:hypothetical protein
VLATPRQARRTACADAGGPGYASGLSHDPISRMPTSNSRAYAGMLTYNEVRRPDFNRLINEQPLKLTDEFFQRAAGSWHFPLRNVYSADHGATAR